MKNKKSKGIIENIRQSKRQERIKAYKEKEKEIIKHDKQREEYAKELEEDKKDLIKLKQGILSREDIYGPDNDQKKKYTIWQKFKNFIYHNKWWLGIVSFFAVIAGFLIYDKLTAQNPDVNFMLLSENTDINIHTEEIEKYFSSIIEDYNEDGKNYANLIYIPISDDENANNTGMYETNAERMFTQINLGVTLLAIADENLKTVVEPEELFVDLESYYPNNSNVKKYAFYFKGTDFAEKIGYEGELPDDLYISVSKMPDTYMSQKETKRTFDNAMKTIDALIKDLSAGNHTVQPDLSK